MALSEEIQIYTEWKLDPGLSDEIVSNPLNGIVWGPIFQYKIMDTSELGILELHQLKFIIFSLDIPIKGF